MAGGSGGTGSNDGGNGGAIDMAGTAASGGGSGGAIGGGNGGSGYGGGGGGGISGTFSAAMPMVGGNGGNGGDGDGYPRASQGSGGGGGGAGGYGFFYPSGTEALSTVSQTATGGTGGTGGNGGDGTGSGGGGGGGDGGAGAELSSAVTFSVVADVTGGAGGDGGNNGQGELFGAAGGNGGNGGAGLVFAAGGSVTVDAVIKGGNGGTGGGGAPSGMQGLGGAGIVGADISVTLDGTGGSITGGMGRGGQADAIDVTGGTSSLTLANTFVSADLSGGIGIGGELTIDPSGSATLANLVHDYTDPTTGTTTGGRLIVTGGTLVLENGGDTYSGGTTIDQGASLELTATGAQGNGAISGAGGVIVDGPVTLADAGDSYGGGTTIDTGGTLTLRESAAAGTGAITFSGSGSTLAFAPAVLTLGNQLDAFLPGATVDLTGFVADSATLEPDNMLQVKGASGTVDLQLDKSQNYAGYTFVTTADGNGGTDVGVQSPVTTEPSTDAALFGSTTTDVSSVGGQVYALYQTILGRAPDPVGFETQVAAVEAGASLQSVAQGLLTSAEYANDYGSTVAPNSGFINQLYEDGLHRPADSGGQQLFGTQLADGTSRAEVAVEIATSPESSNDLAPTFANGVFVPDASDSMVARLYYGLLDRTPDAGGLQGDEMAVDAGTSIGQVIQGMLGSSEYQGTSVGQDNLAYIENLYQTALGRQGDAAGLQAYETGLDTGSLSRANVADDFLTSTEFQSDEAGQSNASYVNAVFEAALGRAADPNGSAYWQNMLNNGVSRSQVAEDIVGSAEFSAKVTAPGQAEFVTALYEGALGRAPAASEVQGWQNVLNAGASLATVAASIVESPEAANHLAPKIEVGHYVT